jgi:hypothetical protein
MSTAQVEPTKRHRKGIYQRLLCTDCERIVAEYEDYAAKVLNGGIPVSVQQFPDKLLIGNLDYTRFKLFQMSLLWRAHVSTDRTFKNIQLGPHAESMRKMLLTRTPGETHQYGCLLFYSSSAFNLMKGIIYPFERLKKKIAGFTVYRTVLAGLLWSYVVSNHSESFPHQQGFLQKSGELPIYNSGPLGDKFMFEFAADFKKSGKIDEILSRKKK